MLQLRTKLKTKHTCSIFYIACCVVVLMQYNTKIRIVLMIFIDCYQAYDGMK